MKQEHVVRWTQADAERIRWEIERLARELPGADASEWDVIDEEPREPAPRCACCGEPAEYSDADAASMGYDPERCEDCAQDSRPGAILQL